MDELKRLVIINATRYLVGFPQCAGCVYLQPDVATCSHDGFTECGEHELRQGGELAASILALLYRHGACMVKVVYPEAVDATAFLFKNKLAEPDETGALHLTQLGELVARKNQDNGYKGPEVK